MTFDPKDIGKDSTFHWADYVVFGISLAISLGIGVYFAFAGRNKNTAEEFLLGGRSVHWIPAGVSLLVSILNAGFVIGMPAETYFFGSEYALWPSGMVIMWFVTCIFYLPTYHKMKVTSAHEYFDRRFNFKPLRIIVSLAFLINMLLLLAVVLYIPALSFSEVTDISQNWLIAVCGGVCVVYTTLGGIKAVVWTDTVQSVIMVGGMIAIMIKGAMDIGDIETIKDRCEEGNRLDFWDFDYDPRNRVTVWTQTLGWGLIIISMYGGSQITIQRYLAMKNLTHCVLALTVTTVGGVLLFGLVNCTGYVMYAYYYYCDPMVAQRISKGDQLVPRFLMDTVGDKHGLPGLFLASVFSAALSTVSSALNSMAAVTLEDFIRPIWKMSSKQAMWISKILAFFYGLVTIGLSFAAEHMGERVVEIPATIWGALAAPVLGAFTLGIFFKWSTGVGSALGTLMGLGLGFWMSIGGVYKGTDPAIQLPLGTQCVQGAVPPGFQGPPPPPKGDDDLQDFYDVSYAWYALLTCVTTVLFGLIFSLIHLGCVSKQKRKELLGQADPNLLFWGYGGSSATPKEKSSSGHHNPAYDGND